MRKTLRDRSIDDQGDDSYHQHYVGCDRPRMKDAVVAFITDEEGHRNQNQRVDKSRQYTRALVSEGFRGAAGPASKKSAQGGKPQAGNIEKIVPAITEK